MLLNGDDTKTERSVEKVWQKLWVFMHKWHAHTLFYEVELFLLLLGGFL